jgi:hypothetical protein
MIERSVYIRAIWPLAAVAALSACGGGNGGEAGSANAAAESEEVAEAPKVDPALVISGTVMAPEGETLEGAKALACLTPQETCTKDASAPVTIENGVGRYEIVVPEKGDYHVMVWKDVNGNEQPDGGDILAFANNMEALPSGERLTPMTAFVRAAGNAEMTTNTGGLPYRMANAAGAAEAVKTAGLAGKWSQQSFGSELVWGPEIKFQPAMATAGFGTNLGGTFGAGSATNTTIVYSYKPVQVKRTTTLNVAPDGTFHMVAQMERRQGKCTPVREERFGHVRQEGDQTIFSVADVRQKCGNGKMEKLKLEKADYTLVRNGNGFTLKGDKGASLSFSKS